MLKMATTNVFERNAVAYYNKGKRRAFNEGGTSSSKTVSIIQLIIIIAMYSKVPLLISIVSESVPHLRRGCIRDFKRIMGDAFDDDAWHGSDSSYSFPSGVQLEFFSADDSSKLRGGRRDILYINECNNITRASFNELDVRTRLFTFLDWNPTSEFWAYEMKNDPENEWIHSTYLDAKHVLPEAVVKNIESRKGKDPNWWNVYGLGLIGNIEGLVHPSFTQIDTIPSADGIVFYGLDFGFANDPTALVYNKIIGDNIYSNELIYETGLTSNQIIKRLESLYVAKDYDEIFADCADPRLIAEIQDAGFNCKAAPKGQDSVRTGISKVNEYYQFWTKGSTHGIYEQRNYRYIRNSDGKLTNKPIDDFNHLMDARRYGVVGKLSAGDCDIYSGADYERDINSNIEEEVLNVF